ncbi:MAG: hypothetical protein AVDCRST_MAG61-3129 [uncultured Friedmanniella sp.]|uniref:Uncharacterized protein n=1 Tax=uncultured Friedmanniella sp. TaxID=335381 RepID=A0A6J4LK87_9ACTN|nr:MAG: hypothetical protein AVDCRST_MAG61-3129 [uncultured Friedmanniella sp.]
MWLVTGFVLVLILAHSARFLRGARRLRPRLRRIELAF